MDVFLSIKTLLAFVHASSVEAQRYRDIYEGKRLTWKQTARERFWDQGSSETETE